MTATLERPPTAAGEPRARPPRTGRARTLSAWAWGAVGVLAIVAIWELYKLLAPADGVVIGGARVLPRTTDLAMPHV
jgi:NitT/TauT family transport system permease protein